MGKVRSGGTACYAQGGAVIGKTSEFMKTPDEFREGSDDAGPDDQTYGKGGQGQAAGNPNPKTKNKGVKKR